MRSSGSALAENKPTRISEQSADYTPKNHLLAGSSEIPLVNDDDTNSDLKDIDSEEILKRSEEILNRSYKKMKGRRIFYEIMKRDNDDKDVPDLEETPQLKEVPVEEPVAESRAFTSDISPFTQLGDDFDSNVRKPQRAKSGFRIDSEFEKLKSMHDRLPVFHAEVEEEVTPVKSLKVPKSSKAVAFENPKDEDDEDDEDEDEDEEKPSPKVKPSELKSRFSYTYKSPKGGFAIPGKNRTQTAEIMENLRAELWFKGYAQNLSGRDREKAINALSYKKLQTELAKFK
jgi:hypothetical protein